VLAVLWVILIGSTHLALRPAGASTGQRLAGAAVVGGLSFLVAAPLAFSANVAYSASSLVNTVFTPDDDNKSETLPTITNKVDPWADKDRLNVLILGGDSGTGRSEKLSMRADTVIVASIDTHTGATTLFSIPRQTARMPFPDDSKLSKYFPNGWYDGRDPLNPDYWLNAMYRFAPTFVPEDVLGKTRFLPEDIMKVSVGEALGLDIDYFVNVNLDGFKDIINALGGVTLNVNSPLPIGGDKDRNIPPKEWIEPGPDQHLSGRLAMWYARGRWGYDDYSRMSRQRCVINAVAHQANPQNVLLNFEKIAAAGEKTVTTDIPQSMLPAMLELANRVQDTTLRSIVFINGKDGFSTTNPNWPGVAKRVKTALKETAKSNPESASPTATASPDGTGSPSATPTKASSSAKPTKSGKPKSDDLSDECGYNPTDYIPLGYKPKR
jgi:LCP family protein required for cell wall assembly